MHYNDLVQNLPINKTHLITMKILELFSSGQTGTIEQIALHALS